MHLKLSNMYHRVKDYFPIIIESIWFDMDNYQGLQCENIHHSLHEREAMVTVSDP